MCLSAISCHKRETEEAAYARIHAIFVSGRLEQCQNEARANSVRLAGASPERSWRFRILEAQAAVWRGLYQDALDVLRSVPPSGESEFLVPSLTLQGIAESRLHQFSAAEQNLQKADQLCQNSSLGSCGEVIQARGLLANEREQLSEARRYFQLTRTFSEEHKDQFLQSTSLLNLAAAALKQERFDEAIDWALASLAIARKLGAGDVELVANGNLGWAYFRLGDSERALALFQHAEQQAAVLGDVYDRENELTNIGYVYMNRGQYDRATTAFEQALHLAEGLKAQQDSYNALRVLARLALLQNAVDKAGNYADRALEIARASGIHADELYPMLVRGKLADLRGVLDEAKQTFEAVEQDPDCPTSLKWETQHSLARLYEDQKQSAKADEEYRQALGTLESARSAVHREDFQLSFLTNAAQVYDDYIQFLMGQKKPDIALRWADYSRARTLSEGLGLLLNGKQTQIRAQASLLNAQSIARKMSGALLFYWLGQKQSYLWAITPERSRVFALPPRAEIEEVVNRYRLALTGPGNPLTFSDDGRALYRMLVLPAEALLKRNQRVFVLPDGALNELNFETLIVPDPKPHYWIEDTDVVNASSLLVLAASLKQKSSGHPRVLLIGNSISPAPDYPELPKAADQMQSVAKHFPAREVTTYARSEATPSAFLGSDPAQYSFIHFVAHGTASRLSPLDSAIILSREPGNADSFKLYAREITHLHLDAELVTVSACYSVGDRQYSGEGLVGLAWAFLRAGARNVVAALWEVSDASTDQLMDRFYEELANGAPPDAALRAAKLSLLHGNTFYTPFYWAPFQIFKG